MDPIASTGQRRRADLRSNRWIAEADRKQSTRRHLPEVGHGLAVLISDRLVGGIPEVCRQMVLVRDGQTQNVAKCPWDMKNTGEVEGCIAIRAGAGRSSLCWKFNGANSFDLRAVLEDRSEWNIVASESASILRDTARDMLVRGNGNLNAERERK